MSRASLSGTQYEEVGVRYFLRLLTSVAADCHLVRKGIVVSGNSVDMTVKGVEAIS